MGVRKKSFNEVEWRRLRAWLRGRTYAEVMKESALPLTLARVAAANPNATYLDPRLVEDILQILPDHPSKAPKPKINVEADLNKLAQQLKDGTHYPLRGTTYKTVARGTCPKCNRPQMLLRFVFIAEPLDDELMCEDCGALHDANMQELQQN